MHHAADHRLVAVGRPAVQRLEDDRADQLRLTHPPRPTLPNRSRPSRGPVRPGAGEPVRTVVRQAPNGCPKAVRSRPGASAATSGALNPGSRTVGRSRIAVAERLFAILGAIWQDNGQASTTRPYPAPALRWPPVNADGFRPTPVNAVATAWHSSAAWRWRPSPP